MCVTRSENNRLFFIYGKWCGTVEIFILNLKVWITCTALGCSSKWLSQIHCCRYYLATEETDPATLHLYSVSDNIETAPNKPFCISCGVRTAVDDTQCLYVRSSFSRNSSYFTLTCLGPWIPEIAVFNKVLTYQLTNIFALLLYSYVTCCHTKTKQKMTDSSKWLIIFIIEGF